MSGEEVKELSILHGFPTKESPTCRKRWEYADGDVECTTKVIEQGCIQNAAILCLNQGDPVMKAKLTLAASAAFQNGMIGVGTYEKEGEEKRYNPPHEPARNVQTVEAKHAPKRGKGGSLGNRVKLVHALAHIESVAIDLSWDMVARFGQGLPVEFFQDWVQVAEDEARHFLMWNGRLKELDSSYGAEVTHSGLWKSAQETSEKIEERLVIEHMVLEARGLDVAPLTYRKFLKAGDADSAEMLEAIFAEEISHVNKGLKWFKYILENSGRSEKLDEQFRSIVKSKFRGNIKPPFNEQARELAGLSPSMYDPRTWPEPSN